MNSADADHLAQRIGQTWRGGPTAAAWADVLTELDAPRAEAAFRRLRTEAENTPSVARFLATYRSLTTDRPDPTAPHCGRCASTGMVTVWEQHGDQTVTACAPCTCEAGTSAAVVLRAIRHHNDTELDRTNPDRNRTWRRLNGPPEPDGTTNPATLFTGDQL